MKENYYVSTNPVPNKTNTTTHPLMSWDLSGSFYWNTYFSHPSQEKAFLERLARMFGWQNDLKRILQKNYLALVLTDRSSVIRWVNKGFTEMTGYSSHFAIGRTPGFLQGPDTSREQRDELVRKLGEQKPFHHQITNYRRNQELYECALEVHPLIDRQGQVEHYLALEWEA